MKTAHDITPTKTIAEQIKSVAREITLRRGVYRSRVQQGKMKESEASHELACMQSVLETLQKREEQTLMNPVRGKYKVKTAMSHNMHDFYFETEDGNFIDVGTLQLKRDFDVLKFLEVLNASPVSLLEATNG